MGEINVLPTQREQFSLTHTCGERKSVERLKSITLDCSHKLASLHFRQGRHLGCASARRADHFRHVPLHQAHAQRVIEQILSGVERVRVDTEQQLPRCPRPRGRDPPRSVDQQHIFPLSQVYEGLLLQMGEKNNDGGQFFTPREVIRAMVRAVDPTARRDRLRPVLRHRRLPRPELRVHLDARQDAAKRRRRPTS